MRHILAIVLTTILSFVVDAQDAKPATEDSKLLTEAQAFQKELFETLRKGDRTALEKMIGDGFLFIHSTGMLETREEYLKNSAAGNLFAQRAEIETLEETWRVYEGPTVIRYARSVMRDKAANTEARMRYITVYIKTAAKGWQWVSGQSTKLPVRPKAAEINRKAYDHHAGIYQISAERTFTVTKENGALYALTTGRMKSELIPASETTFVLFNENNDPGYMVVTFTRGDGEKASEAVLQMNGQEVRRAKRRICAAN